MSEYSAAIAAIVTEASALMLQADADKKIRSKEGAANFVTAYDTAVQEFLYAKLAAFLPEAVFIGEESEENHTELLRSRLAFIIDPIDGTTNFIHDYRHSAISVALCDKGTVVSGVVCDPYLGEIFRADLGKGAFVNDRAIRVSDRPLKDGVVTFGTTPYWREYTDRTFDLIKELFRRSCDIRRSGSAALDLCYIAAGRTDAFVELLLSPWDYAAGSLLVNEAGGIVTDFAGDPLPFEHGSSVVAGGAAAWKEARSVAEAIVLKR